MEELKKQLLAAAKCLTVQIDETTDTMVLEGSEIYDMTRAVEILVNLICVIDDRVSNILGADVVAEGVGGEYNDR